MSFKMNVNVCIDFMNFQSTLLIIRYSVIKQLLLLHYLFKINVGPVCMDKSMFKINIWISERKVREKQRKNKIKAI